MSNPGVFGLPHLSEDAVAAFADGVLSQTATARARRHCAECAECAAAVRGQREAVMLLRSAPAPSLPQGLLARLSGLAMTTSLPTSRSGLPIGVGPDGSPVLISYTSKPPKPPDESDDPPTDAAGSGTALSDTAGSDTAGSGSARSDTAEPDRRGGDSGSGSGAQSSPMVDDERAPLIGKQPHRYPWSNPGLLLRSRRVVLPGGVLGPAAVVLRP